VTIEQFRRTAVTDRFLAGAALGGLGCILAVSLLKSSFGETTRRANP
jgi:hypothetical protein